MSDTYCDHDESWVDVTELTPEQVRTLSDDSPNLYMDGRPILAHLTGLGWTNIHPGPEPTLGVLDGSGA